MILATNNQSQTKNSLSNRQLSQLLQLNCKSALKMKLYSSPEHTIKTKDSFISLRQAQTAKLMITPKHIIKPIILKDVDSENGGRDGSRFSMNQLCRIFLDKIQGKEFCKFEAKELIDQTGVKQRRIYDLMNILEGCNFVKRVSKGTYIWYGFDKQIERQKQQRKKKENTSLSSLAAKVKHILHGSKSEIDFQDICQLISNQSNDKTINANSIKRRVYQCCKVLRFFGLIEKKTHKYQWISQQDRQKQIQKVQLASTNNTEQTANLKKLNSFEDDQEKRSLIRQLLKNLSNEEEFTSLILLIKQQFEKTQIKRANLMCHRKKLFNDDQN